MKMDPNNNRMRRDLNGSLPNVQKIMTASRTPRANGIHTGINNGFSNNVPQEAAQRKMVNGPAMTKSSSLSQLSSLKSVGRDPVDSVYGSRDQIPNANYSKLSESIRKNAPNDALCAMFCGGKRCKYDSSVGWAPKDMAIEGLYSTWITDDILAMARPSNILIQTASLIEKFKQNKIRTIINLQIPGEHGSCGPPLDPESKFTYDPNLFMREKIFFYNFHWKDYSEVSDYALLDMVKVMTFALSEGRVAVHCHAGLGRTGVLIACYLVYANRFKPQEVIRYIRQQRPNSIQTSGQVESVMSFAQFIVPLFIVFPHVIPKHNGLTITQFVYRQKLILHGNEQRNLKYIPKIIFMVCERLLALCNKRTTLNHEVHRHRSITEAPITFGAKGVDLHRKTVKALNKKKTIEKILQNGASNGASDEPLHANSTYGSNSSSRSTSKNTSKSNSRDAIDTSTSAMDDLAPERVLSPISQLLILGLDTPKKHFPVTGRAATARTSSSDLVNTIREDLFGPPATAPTTTRTIKSAKELNNNNIAPAKPSLLRMLSGEEEPDDMRKASVSSGRGLKGMTKSLMAELATERASGHVTTERVTRALLADYRARGIHFVTKLYAYQNNLNDQPKTWEALSKEKDLDLLAALLWSWLENLSEPVINTQSLTYIVLKAERPIDALSKLETTVRHTFEYLIGLVFRLELRDGPLRECLLRRLLAALTHQCFRPAENWSPSAMALLVDLSDEADVDEDESSDQTNSRKKYLIPPNVKWGEMRKGTLARLLLFSRSFYDVIVVYSGNNS